MRFKTVLIFIGALILLVVAVVAYKFEYSLVSAKSARVASLETQIQEKTQSSLNTTTANSEMATLSTEQTQLNQYFVSPGGVVQYLNQVTAAGNYLGATVTTASVSAVPSDALEKLNLSLTISGSFNSVMRTLGFIEYGPYGTTISSLSLATASSTQATGKPQWLANVTFSVGAQTVPNTTP